MAAEAEGRAGLAAEWAAWDEALAAIDARINEDAPEAQACPNLTAHRSTFAQRPLPAQGLAFAERAVKVWHCAEERPVEVAALLPPPGQKLLLVVLRFFGCINCHSHIIAIQVRPPPTPPGTTIITRPRLIEGPAAGAGPAGLRGGGGSGGERGDGAQVDEAGGRERSRLRGRGPGVCPGLRLPRLRRHPPPHRLRPQGGPAGWGRARGEG